jgi:hypothetical protein
MPLIDRQRGAGGGEPEPTGRVMEFLSSQQGLARRVAEKIGDRFPFA